MLHPHLCRLLPLIDLHTHTDASDGRLSPAELVHAAGEAGVDVLAITDHDTIAGVLAAPRAGRTPAIVTGVEFSTTWNGIGVHVLGLNIDTASDAIAAGTAFQRTARERRAVRIGERLARAGIPDAFDRTSALAANGNVSRVHFAQFLVEAGYVKDRAQAFKRYLGAGKAGDVRDTWAALPLIIGWIRDAGGSPVLAHPMKYRLTRTKRTALVDDFAAAGGTAMEIVSGRQDAAQTRALADLCTSRNLLASAGSDFHRPGEPWARLGMPLALPRECRPVWDAW